MAASDIPVLDRQIHTGNVDTSTDAVQKQLMRLWKEDILVLVLFKAERSGAFSCVDQFDEQTLLKEFPVLFSVTVEAWPAVAKRMGVTKVPCVLGTKKGVQVGAAVYGISAKSIRAGLDSWTKAAPPTKSSLKFFLTGKTALAGGVEDKKEKEPEATTNFISIEIPALVNAKEGSLVMAGPTIKELKLMITRMGSDVFTTPINDDLKVTKLAGNLQLQSKDGVAAIGLDSSSEKAVKVMIALVQLESRGFVARAATWLLEKVRSEADAQISAIIKEEVKDGLDAAKKASGELKKAAMKEGVALAMKLVPPEIQAIAELLAGV